MMGALGSAMDRVLLGGLVRAFANPKTATRRHYNEDSTLVHIRLV